MWKKNTIQKTVEQKAHKNGIRVSHICACGTSKLAYDGSRYALRGTEAGNKSYSICRFQNGKTYNCDLSASYNIGARYFIREIQQNQSVKNWSVITAKVPECQKRTQCTYNTLLKINALDMVSWSADSSHLWLSLCVVSIFRKEIPAKQRPYVQTSTLSQLNQTIESPEL